MRKEIFSRSIYLQSSNCKKTVPQSQRFIFRRVIDCCTTSFGRQQRQNLVTYLRSLFSIMLLYKAVRDVSYLIIPTVLMNQSTWMRKNSCCWPSLLSSAPSTPPKSSRENPPPSSVSRYMYYVVRSFFEVSNKKRFSVDCPVSTGSKIKNAFKGLVGRKDQPDLCFEVVLKELVVQIGVPGTDDDVFARVCSDVDGSQCCKTPALKSKLFDDWSKNDKETWGESYFGSKKGECKDFSFKVIGNLTEVQSEFPIHKRKGIKIKLLSRVSAKFKTKT